MVYPLWLLLAAAVSCSRRSCPLSSIRPNWFNFFSPFLQRRSRSDEEDVEVEQVLSTSTFQNLTFSFSGKRERRRKRERERTKTPIRPRFKLSRFDNTLKYYFV